LGHLIDMVYGDPRTPIDHHRVGVRAVAIVLPALGLLLLLGLWVPTWLLDAIGQATKVVAP
jgi:hypothetical protein